MSAYKRFTFNDETEGPVGPVGPTGPQGPSGNFVGKIKDWQSEFVPIQLPGQPLFHIEEDGDDIYLGLAGPGVGRGVGIPTGTLNIYDTTVFQAANFAGVRGSYGLPMDKNNGAPPERINEQQWIIAYDVDSDRRGYIPIYYPDAADIELNIGGKIIKSGETILFDASANNNTTYDTSNGDHRIYFNSPDAFTLDNSNNFVGNDVSFNIPVNTNTDINTMYDISYVDISLSAIVNMTYDISSTDVTLEKTTTDNVKYTKFVIPYEYQLLGRSQETAEFVFYVQWT